MELEIRVAKTYKKWWILLVTAAGTSLTFLDITIIPVALPTIQKQFGFSHASIVWVVNAYLLSLTSLLLVGGRLCDLLGKRTLFIWGFSVLGAGSVISAFSFSAGSLLFGRAVQGLAGAMIIPTTGALLIATFPLGERAKVLGINTAIGSIFLIMGPPIGGFLTQFLTWRSIFFMNLPLVAFGIIMTLLIVQPNKRKKERFHFGGAFILMAGIVFLVVGLMESNTWGWSSFWTISLLLLSPVCFILFIWRSLHV